MSEPPTPCRRRKRHFWKASADCRPGEGRDP
jgi:hypothetical protein